MGRLGFSSRGSLLQKLKLRRSDRRASLELDLDREQDWWSPRARAQSTTLPKTQDGSDHETETASLHSSDGDAPTTRLDAVLAVGRKMLQTTRSLRSASREWSDSDFAPLAQETPVWTRFGLGVVDASRDDGITVVRLQAADDEKARFYLNPHDDECFAVPALLQDWVHMTVGDGRVVAFNPITQVYAVRISGDLEFLAHVHRRHVHRIAPTRRTTLSGYAYHRQTTRPSNLLSTSSTSASVVPQALQRGLSTAFRVIKTKSNGLSTTTAHFMSNVYYHNQCVRTSFGEGTIIAFDHAHARVQVQLVCGATAYLAVDEVQHYTKALVGMEVTTKDGMGTVTAIQADEGIYTVQLYTPREGESKVVDVLASDLTKSRRVRLENVKDRLQKNKLVAYAQRKAKLFGTRSNNLDHEPAPERSFSCRTLSMREEEEYDVEPITAGI